MEHDLGFGIIKYVSVNSKVEYAKFVSFTLSSPFPFPYDFTGKEATLTKGDTYNKYFKLKGTQTLH